MQYRHWTIGLILACVCFMVPSSLRADSWGPPTLEHWSKNRQYLLRVDEKKKTLTLLHVTPQGKTRLWSTPPPRDGTFFTPYTAHVRDDGRYVVLQDQHGGLGYGKVLVFLDEHGQQLHAYSQ